jgi:hypothetical protein
MKKNKIEYILTALISLSIFFVVLTPVFSQDYSITRITENNYQEFAPQINNQGTIVWTAKVGPSGCGKNCHEIFFYRDGVITRLTNNLVEDANPQINDNGYIVWQQYDGEDWEILLFDGDSITQLTNNFGTTDIDPQIDNNNNVVWRRYYSYYECSNNDIFFHNGIEEYKISLREGCKESPRISPSGTVVWQSHDCYRFAGGCEQYAPVDLYTYNGTFSYNLTQTGTVGEHHFQVNDAGNVVFTTRVGGDPEIFLHDGITAYQVTSNEIADLYPKINANNFITWETRVPYEIFVYDGTSVMQLTNNEYEDRAPEINNQNQIVWHGAANVDECGDYYWSVWDIFVFNGLETVRLTDDCKSDLNPHINDAGLITWTKGSATSGWDREIYLAVPAREPVVDIKVPSPDQALQDSVLLSATVSGLSGIPNLYFYVRTPLGDEYGIPIGYEDLPAMKNPTTGDFEYLLDTTALADGYYLVFAKLMDAAGNEYLSDPVPFSIRNWAIVDLLPISKRYKAGRTMPVKFSLRISSSVDLEMPFVYNEQLLIKIYDLVNPHDMLQVSSFGDNSKDYRIDAGAELYITNFKTAKTPAQYRVEIWRSEQDFLIGQFQFETVY